MYCDICGKFSSRKDNLKRHKRLVHQKKVSQIEKQPKKNEVQKMRRMTLIPVKTIRDKKGRPCLKVCTLKYE